MSKQSWAQSASQRTLAVWMAFSLIAGMNLPALAAQDAPAPKLQIVIVEGEGAINNIKLRTAREPIIEVQDENHRPVAGAAVLFTLPGRGPGGTFSQGGNTFSTTTNAEGRAVGRGLQPNTTSGRFQILVNATYAGVSASAAISQRNKRPGLSTTTKVLITAGLIAGAVVGTIVATRGGGSTPTVITAGPPVIGGTP